MTVSDDELLELLQVIETMIRLGDVECAVATVRDWMRAHPGEARVIYDIGNNEALFSEMTLDVMFVLHGAYASEQMEHFNRSKIQANILFRLIDDLVSKDKYRSWVLSLKRQCYSSLSGNLSANEIRHSIAILTPKNRPTGKWENTGRKIAIEFQRIIVWTREQYLARQAWIRALQSDFEKATRALSLLEKHLEEVDPDNLYIYTGLPYVPGPGEEL
jgi:hypothetical protein